MEDRRDTGRSKVLKDLDETLNLSRLDTNRNVLVKTAGIFRDVEQIMIWCAFIGFSVAVGFPMDCGCCSSSCTHQLESSLPSFGHA